MAKPSTQLPFYVPCEDAIDFLTKIQAFSRRRWIFRGHGHSILSGNSGESGDDWKLESCLWRYLKKHRNKIIKPSWYPREKIAIQRFQQIAHLHLRHLPMQKDTLTWLALMQHYGAPTRLLDFTFNPAIALFFALRDATPDDKPWCVHAIHLQSVRGRTFTIRQNANPTKTPSPWPKATEYHVGSKPENNSFIGIFDGRLASARQEAQDGLFIVPNRIDLDIETWLADFNPKTSLVPYGSHWIKFVFENKRSRYYQTIKQLMQMGISPVRLFPGLEGFCESFNFSWLDVVQDLDPGDVF